VAEAETFDVVIIGGGTGGYSTALRAAQLGKKVALVERGKVGGTCLHVGCIPTKALLQSAEVAETVADAKDFGVNATFEGIEVAAVQAHKDSVVGAMYKGLVATLKGRGVETIEGSATFTDAHTVEVTGEGATRTLTAPDMVIATGSAPREIPIAKFDGERILSSDHALVLDHVPERAIVLGAGAVGMEFATVWSAFGGKVTVVEMMDALLPLEDPDVSKEIGRAFRKRGVETLTGTKLVGVETSASGVKATVETGGGQQTIEADILLVAIGRGPVTEGLGLDTIGIETDRGFVKVDEWCKTNVDGVWAVGDVIPTLGLAHASFAEGFLVAEQIAGVETFPIDYIGVPRVTYSHPEVASVGYTEPQALEAGFDIVVERYPFQAIGRAKMMKASGIVKVIAEKDGRVLGVHSVGPRATDLIAEAQLIYNWEALPIDVARLVHPHPTLTEALGEAHLALAGRALHG